MRVAESLLNILFPKRCEYCAELVGFLPECSCKYELEKLELADCVVSQSFCGGRTINIWACYQYKYPVRNAIIEFKNNCRDDIVQRFANELYHKIHVCGLREQYDCIVAVPMSAQSYKDRGYNQSLLLARSLSDMSGIPLLDNYLIKIKETKNQHLASKKERLVNLQDAFVVQNETMLNGERVLIVDDVKATGSTILECAKVLLASGAGECGALCVAASI